MHGAFILFASVVLSPGHTYPAGQGEQIPAPEDEYLPAGQGLQESDPAAENVPAAQICGVAEVDAQLYPAGHCIWVPARDPE